MESVEEVAGLAMDVMDAKLRGVALYAHLHRISLENAGQDRYGVYQRAF